MFFQADTWWKSKRTQTYITHSRTVENGFILYSVTSSHRRFSMFKSFSLEDSLQSWNSLNVWHVPGPDGIFMFHRMVFFCYGQQRQGLSKCRQNRRFITNVLEWNHKNWNKGHVDVFTICLLEQIRTELMWANRQKLQHSKTSEILYDKEKTSARDLSPSRNCKKGTQTHHHLHWAADGWRRLWEKSTTKQLI